MFVEKGYSIYEQRNAIRQIDDNFRYFIDDAKYKEMERFAVKGGDMLMSCSGTIGRFVVLNDNPTKGVINQALLKISPDSSKIDTHYLLFVLKNFIKSADSLTQGAAIKNIVAVKELKKISVPLPDLNDQKKVVDKMNTLSELINNLQSNYQQKINNLEELKKSFLQKAFNGELNIPKEGVTV
jgi:type I restriction enzyme S subunit